MPKPDLALPILGEPLLADFANTRYSDQRSSIDVFDRVDWCAAWFRNAPCASVLSAPARFRSEDLEGLRALRDALRALLGEVGVVGRPEAVACINEASALDERRRVLVLSSDSLSVAVQRQADPIDSLLSAIAGHVIDAVDSEELGRVVKCRRPSCPMYFVRDHHRRRYCNTRCANADRQHRYHARVRSGRSSSVS